MECQKCEADWTGKHGKRMADCEALYCRNRVKERLAAYEDTCLEPEEVAALKQENECLRRELDILKAAGASNPNCVHCEHMDKNNGNCTTVGGFCTAVPAAHCPKLKELMEKQGTQQAAKVNNNHSEFLDYWAATLNNRSEKQVVPAAAYAEDNLVVVYAASDDLVEIEGALTQEIDAYNGVKLTANRAQGFYESAVGEDPDIEFRWCDDSSNDPVCPWSVICNLPHRTFGIVDSNGFVSSIGVVLHLNDIPE